MAFQAAVDNGVSISRMERDERASQKGKSAPLVYPNAYDSYASNFVHQLELKSYYTGEIEGMLDVLKEQGTNTLP